jgi:hypothetical protein
MGRKTTTERQATTQHLQLCDDHDDQGKARTRTAITIITTTTTTTGPNRRREQLFVGWKRGAGRPGTMGRSSGHDDDRDGETATRRRRRRRRQRRRRTQDDGTILSPAF